MGAVRDLHLPYSMTMLSDAQLRARFDAALALRWPKGKPAAAWEPIYEVAREWAAIRGYGDGQELRYGLIDIALSARPRWSSALPPSIDDLMETHAISWTQVESLKKMWRIAVSRMPRVSWWKALRGGRFFVRSGF